MNNHKNLDNVYVPETGLVYPDQPDQPMLNPKIIRQLNIDENYPYLDKSLKARIWHVLIYAGIFLIVFPLQKIRYGLKVEGRENFRNNKKLFKERGGALTICNHVYRWDFLAVLQAIKFRRSWFPARADNLLGKDAALIRAAGGIPIPETMSAMRKFNEAFDELHAKKKWIHLFPESCRWDFYQPIRPFKKGAFTMAYRYNLPVLPLAISYREPGKIRKAFGVKHPLITIHIGKPLLMDTELSRKDACAKIRLESHKALCDLAGIVTNQWPAEGD